MIHSFIDDLKVAMCLLSNVDDVLDEVVPSVVARYREAGVLTWTLIHQIESEVLKEVLTSGQLSAEVVNMVRSHEAFRYPKDNRLASFEGHELMPIVFGAIRDAWKRVH
jgi:hypothetical protein